MKLLTQKIMKKKFYQQKSQKKNLFAVKQLVFSNRVTSI